MNLIIIEGIGYCACGAEHTVRSAKSKPKRCAQCGEPFTEVIEEDYEDNGLENALKAIKKVEKKQSKSWSMRR